MKERAHSLREREREHGLVVAVAKREQELKVIRGEGEPTAQGCTVERGVRRWLCVQQNTSEGRAQIDKGAYTRRERTLFIERKDMHMATREGMDLTV